MPKSARMKWGVPGQHLDPWYDAFAAMIAEMDADAYASREDRNILLTGGGTIAFNTTSGLLTWSAAFELVAPTGFLWTLPAGSITLAEGETLYVELSRAPTSAVTLTAAKTTQLSAVTDQRAVLALAVRRSDQVWWRVGSFGKSTGPKLSIAFSTGQSNGQNTNKTVGAFQLNPADYTYAPQKFYFVSLGSVTGAFTGRITLFNLTTNTSVLDHDYTTTTTTRQRTAFTPAVGSNIYEIRIRTTTGTPPNDLIQLMWAGVEIENA